jgi:prealbumin domain-containing protein
MRKPYPLPIFVALLALFSRAALAETQSTPTPKPETGLEGVILAGPVFGGPSKQGAPDSKPLADIEFLVKKENSTVASFKTDEQGRFRISLPSGHYTISRKDWNATIGRYGPFEVDVAAGQIKRVRWDCDTGIR